MRQSMQRSTQVLQEEEEVPAIGEWVVTYGDMMSLLLTFFIMLVSMSELKQEERYQAMLESMRRQFGHDTSVTSVMPGTTLQGNSSMAFIAPSQSRARRENLQRGGNNIQAITGDQPLVQSVRQGRSSTTGGVVFFDEDTAELTPAGIEKLKSIAQQVAGKPQKLEIRGHTSRKPVDAELGLDDHWNLAFQRCYQVMQFLIAEGIDPQRIRLGSAGAYEPLRKGLDPEERKQNARVEILMWDERINQFE